MKLKTKQIVLLALTLVMLSACLISIINANGDAVALNFTEPPAGFTGVEAVDFEVDSGYAWHKMTADEYGLTYDENNPIYIAGNSGITARSASNIAIKVTEPGELTFEYSVSTKGSGLFNYFAYGINQSYSQETAFEDCNPIARGEYRTWQSFTITVSESDLVGESKEAIIYIAYVHHNVGTSDTYLNYTAIRNVNFFAGERNDVVQGFNTAMGAVTAKQLVDGKYVDADVASMEVGEPYSLTAKANSGYQFYGWVKNVGGTAEYMAVESGNLNITVDTAASYTPVFATAGTYVIRNGANFFDATTSLKTVIEDAKSGDVLVLLKDATISENITVPAGVTLYIPFRANWEKEEVGYMDKYDQFIQHHLSTTDHNVCHTHIAGEDETYVCLTVSEGIKLTVNGEIAIGAVIGYNSQRYQGHVSGAHGRITNNGTIEVNNGGMLKCYGIVGGDGLVRIKDSGTLKESFVIGDFAGGSNTAELFFTSQMPFKRFSLQSVQCEMQMEAKATLVAMCNIWASSIYNIAEVIMVGDSEAAAFRPNEDAAPGTLALTRIYNAGKSLTDGNNLLDVTGVGRTEWTFSNGLKFQPLTLTLGGITVDTSASDFTIPYNFKIVLEKGTYNIPLGIRLMPGAELVIESGATAYVGGRLMIMDGLVQTDMSGDRYPTRDELTAKNFSGSAEFILNGTLIMKTGSTLGGMVKSDGIGGKLVIEEGVYLNNSGTLRELDQTKDLLNQEYDLYTSEGGVYDDPIIHNWVQQDGALGSYDENTTWFNLPAMIYTANGLQKVEAGKTYLSSALVTPENALYDVTYMYVEDGVYGSIGGGKYGYKTASGKREMTTVTETVVRSMNGVWVDSETVGDTVPVQDPTVVGISGATVTYTTEKSGASTVLNNLQVVDKETGIAKTEKYVFLVKYTVEGNSIGYTIKPDANGNYVIPAEANGVIIESCLKGDLNGNGALDARDVANLKKATVGSIELNELATLAADLNGNGALDARDVANLKKATVGSFTIT